MKPSETAQSPIGVIDLRGAQKYGCGVTLACSPECFSFLRLGVVVNNGQTIARGDECRELNAPRHCNSAKCARKRSEAVIIKSVFEMVGHS